MKASTVSLEALPPLKDIWNNDLMTTYSKRWVSWGIINGKKEDKGRKGAQQSKKEAERNEEIHASKGGKEEERTGGKRMGIVKGKERNGEKR